MSKKQILTIIKYGIPVLLFIAISVLAYKLFGEDFRPFMQWWGTLLVLGITFLPISGRLFNRFHDGGWLFSKTIGLAISGWLLWVFSSVKLLRFTTRNAWIIVVCCLVVNLLVLCYQRKQKNSYEITNNKITAALMSEVLFFFLFFLWCYMRGFKPEAYGTEKFMDYGFMTTMMRSEYMPPEDMWFSGNYINYYYVGQYMATYMTKLSGVMVSYGYNFMMMTLAACGFALPYSVIYNVSSVFIKDVSLKRNVPKFFSASFPGVTGIVAGVAVCFAGNMHYPVYKWIVPYINRVRGLESEGYWFPDATRYIGYNPETHDKTIHEFPLYSFVLGDLHAHVINILFVLTVLALLFAFLLRRKEQMDALRMGLSINEPSLRKEAFQPIILFIGFFIGLFRMTNFWDFPIYYVVSGAIILFSNGVIYQFKKKTILLTALHGCIIYGIGELTALPFTLNFHQISTRICFTVARTPIYQLLILWGLPVILIIIFVINQYRDLAREGNKAKSNKLYGFIENLTISDLFLVTIGLCGIGLILMPEIVYVQDIYSGDYKRANTMFKLTYQAFIMFGLFMGHVIIRYLFLGKNMMRKLIGLMSACFFISTVFYAKNAITAWYGNIFQPDNYKTLDASAFMETESREDFLATNWLNENIQGKPVVLEAQGDSYTYYQRVSVITGLPTIMGWNTHEWLWRSDETGGYPAACQERVDDIKAIYNAQSVEEAKVLLQKYNVSYIYVGGLEREKYENLNEDILKKLGKIVFQVDSTSDTGETYIIEVSYH